ncbi:MAG: DUF6657 family protein [Spirochaetaceae bacterium]
MGEIKSALELALERTAGVQGDKKSVEEYEHKQKGKRLLSQLTENPKLDIKKELLPYKGEQRKWVVDGFVDVALSNLVLPTTEADLERLEPIKNGLAIALGKKAEIEYLFDQAHQLLTQYLENRQQLIEHVRNQFAQRIRQKEEELARQYGSSVRLDPAQDPEFAGVLQQNMRQLQGQYQQVLDQLREEVRRLHQKG